MPQESHCTTHASLFHAAGMPCDSSQSHTVRYIPRHWRGLHAYSCRITVVWTFWSTREFHTDLVSTSQSKISATLFHLSQQHRAKEQDQRYLECMNAFLEKEKTDRSIPIQPAASSHGAARCKTESTNVFLKNITFWIHATTQKARHAAPPPYPDSVSSQHQ